MSFKIEGKFGADQIQMKIGLACLAYILKSIFSVKFFIFYDIHKRFNISTDLI